MARNNGQVTALNLPKGYTVLYINVKQWSAKRHLQASDLDIDETVTKKLANLGTLNAFDAEVLKRFRNLALKANNYCTEFGIKFGDGYLFPESKLNWLIDRLKEIKKEWYELKAQLLASYENELRAWAIEAEKEVAGFGAIIMQRAFSKEYVDNQIHFDWRGIEQEIQSLGSVLLDELAEKAREKQASLETKKAKKGFMKITRLDMRFFDSIVKKLRVNQLLDPRVTPLLKEVEGVYAFLDTIPEKEQVQDNAQFCNIFLRTVAVLMNPELLYGSEALEEQKQDNMFGASLSDVIEGEVETESETEVPAHDLSTSRESVEVEETSSMLPLQSCNEVKEEQLQSQSVDFDEVVDSLPNYDDALDSLPNYDDLMLSEDNSLVDIDSIANLF